MVAWVPLVTPLVVRWEDPGPEPMAPDAADAAIGAAMDSATDQGGAPAAPADDAGDPAADDAGAAPEDSGPEPSASMG